MRRGTMGRRAGEAICAGSVHFTELDREGAVRTWPSITPQNRAHGEVIVPIDDGQRGRSSGVEASLPPQGGTAVDVNTCRCSSGSN